MRRLALFAVVLAAFGCGGEPAAVTSPSNFAGVPGSSTQAEVWYASPSASADGNGTFESPWRLDTALAGGRRVAGARPVGPGDTIYLRGGTYTGRFNITVGGDPSGRIVVSSFPGE